MHASEREREDVRLMRWLFAREQPSFIAEKLWFFDESGLNLSFARIFGRSARGERAIGSAPKDWGATTTLMAGIGCRGLIAPMMLHGSLNGDVFLAYIKDYVVPSIHPGDIIIIDNLAAHKTNAVIESVKQAGASLLFLPPYSPDLNPIELAWSKLKTIVRGYAPRTFDHLVDAVASALRSISNNDIKNWIKHCGYSINSRENRCIAWIC